MEKKPFPKKFNANNDDFFEIITEIMLKPSYGVYGWQFTEEDKKMIRESFITINRNGSRKTWASLEKVEKFIQDIEPCCSAKKHWFIEEPSKGDVRKNRERVLIDCDAAVGHLKQISECKLKICHYDSLEPFGTEDEDDVSDFRLQSFKQATDAIVALEKFIQTVKSYHLSEKKRQGRGTANHDFFVNKIAEIYSKHIRKPAAYKDGAFFSVVKTIFKILDLPSKDPSRAIKSALKKNYN